MNGKIVSRISMFGMPVLRRSLVGLLCLSVMCAFHAQKPVRGETFQFDITGMVVRSHVTVGFELIVPDSAADIRGVFLVFSGNCGDYTGYFEDTTLEVMAASISFGILTLDSGDLRRDGSDYCVFGDPNEGETLDLFNKAIAGAAEVSGRPELNNAPVALLGSSMGSYNSLAVTHVAPERIIGYATVRGTGAANLDMPEELKTVPGVLMAGSLDTVILPSQVQDSFERYRGQDAQIAHLIHWNRNHWQGADYYETNGIYGGARHGSYSTEMAWYWLAEAIRERYPDGVWPSADPGNPVELLDIPMESGWLVETPRLFPAPMASEFPEIVPYSEYEGDASEISWVPNEAVANVYRAFAAIDPTEPNPEAPDQYLSSAIEFTSPPLFFSAPTPPTYYPGDVILATIDPHDFDEPHAISEMAFYDGDRLIGVDTEGPDWGIEYVPNESGIHALVAVAANSEGAHSTTFRVVVVQPSLDPLLGDVNLDGEVNGLDVAPFVDVLLASRFDVAADMNGDGVVNGLDVETFVAIVVGGTQPVPEPSTLVLASVTLVSLSGWRRCRQGQMQVSFIPT